MGVAKNIEAYTVFENYKVKTEEFIKYLSDRLNMDFSVQIFDTEYNLLYDNRGQQENELVITFDKWKVNEKVFELPTYELKTPINYRYEDYLTLTFYPNNGVNISFLTFEHLWGKFVDILKFKINVRDREKEVSHYQLLRIEYSKILKCIGVEKICILTHAYYKIENIFFGDKLRKLVFSDILNKGIQKDKLNPFNLEKIIRAKDVNELNKDFVNTSKLEIMFIDECI